MILACPDTDQIFVPVPPAEMRSRLGGDGPHTFGAETEARNTSRIFGVLSVRSIPFAIQGAPDAICQPA